MLIPGVVVARDPAPIEDESVLLDLNQVCFVAPDEPRARRRDSIELDGRSRPLRRTGPLEARTESGVHFQFRKRVAVSLPQ